MPLRRAQNILLVEANSSSDADLYAAVDYARKYSGVVAVSMSWGGSEYSTEKSDDFHFTTPAGHQGVTFVVAAGDDGAGAEYPSSSPNVMSVGGTSLQVTSGVWSSEAVWSDGGGGVSRYEPLPSYQSGLGISRRGTPDVSYNANPNTGVSVYDTYGGSGWAVFGGTSAGAPQWSALIAIADQGRAQAGQASLANAQALLYTLARTDFHDITAGSNGLGATSGFDLASGLGSPIANLLIPELVTVGVIGGGGGGGNDGGGGTTSLASPVISAASAVSSTRRKYRGPSSPERRAIEFKCCKGARGQRLEPSALVHRQQP